MLTLLATSVRSRALKLQKTFATVHAAEDAYNIDYTADMRDMNAGSVLKQIPILHQLEHLHEMQVVDICSAAMQKLSKANCHALLEKMFVQQSPEVAAELVSSLFEGVLASCKRSAACILDALTERLLSTSGIDVTAHLKQPVTTHVIDKLS